MIASSPWKLLAGILLICLWTFLGITLVTSVMTPHSSKIPVDDDDDIIIKKKENKKKQQLAATTTSSFYQQLKQQHSKGSAIVVVDPYSSGGVLARLIVDRGYQVVRVLSQSSQLMVDQSLPAACQGLEFAATIQVGM